MAGEAKENHRIGKESDVTINSKNSTHAAYKHVLSFVYHSSSKVHVHVSEHILHNVGFPHVYATSFPKKVSIHVHVCYNPICNPAHFEAGRSDSRLL